jgi:hypothetical protein
MRIGRGEGKGRGLPRFGFFERPIRLDGLRRALPIPPRGLQAYRFNLGLFGNATGLCPPAIPVHIEVPAIPSAAIPIRALPAVVAR